MTRYIKRGGKVWIKFSRISRLRLSRLKLAWVAVKARPNVGGCCKPGRVMFEMDGNFAEDVAKEAMRLAAHKLRFGPSLLCGRKLRR